MQRSPSSPPQQESASAGSAVTPTAWSTSATRRGLDILGASIALVLVAPLLVTVALVSALVDGFPVLFRQPRPGKDGVPFDLLKLRTMTAPSPGEPQALTRLGSLLRSTSVDELPQIWNVLIGDMSLVGPRPMLEEDLVDASPAQRQGRQAVLPGITGLAQVRGRNAISFQDRFTLDCDYVARASPALDLEILVATVGTVLRREGIWKKGQEPR